MAIEKTHDMHKNRFSRNVGVGVTLLAFVVIVFGLTVVKMQTGDMMEAADHSTRISMTPAVPATPLAEPSE